MAKQAGSGLLEGLPEILYVKDLAALLRISELAVRRRAKRGAIPQPLHLGRSLAWTREGVLDWLRDGGRPAGTVKMKITLRPYAKDKSRWTIDIRLMNPCTQNQEVRRRYVAPAGLDQTQARAWGERKVPTLLRELVGDAGEHDAVPMIPAVVATPRKETATTINNTITKPVTLAEFYLQRFVPEHVALLKSATRDHYKFTWAKHIAPALGDLPLIAIDDNRLSTFRAGLRKHLAATTANIARAMLMKILRFACKMKVMSVVPTFERIPEPRKLPKNVFSEEQIAKLLAAARQQGTDVLVILLLAIDAGLRVSEICALQWGDIDMRVGSVLVQRNVYQGEFQTPKGRIGKLALTKALHTALVAHHQANGHHGPLVLYRGVGTVGVQAHTPGSIRNAIHKVQDSVGFKRTGPHLLRHTALTRLADLGASVFIIQAVARHSNIKTTQDYLHTQQALLSREAANLVDNRPGPDFGNALATLATGTPNTL